MADMTTDVLIIGTGPAGSATAALLSTYGIENMVVNRYRRLANGPRAHITNQRTIEVLRDLGPEAEAEAHMHATEQDLMGLNVFCESLTGEEPGRIQTWGTHPLSRAEHELSSPSKMNDLPRTFMEPLLFKTACSRGTQARMSCEYQSHEADLSQHVAHRPSVLCWVMQPGSNVGGIGKGVVRMVRPWNEWLAIWGYDNQGARPELTDDEARKIIRDLVGDPDLEIDMQAISYWTVNDAYATQMSRGCVFIMGDAAHRHPPSNGLGSDTSIQDAFNLAWKLAAVLKGQAGEGLLDTYNAERAPIARQIVTRANQSIGEFGPIFEALGLIGHSDPVVMQANMDKRCDNTPDAEAQRTALRDAIAFKKYEFDAHGVEMNQRYRSDAVVTDGQMEPGFDLDPELHYQPTTWPGARIPHVWLYDAQGGRHSTLDLTGGGFALLSGLNGRAWAEAGKAVAADMGIQLSGHIIGPRQPLVDHTGDWARAREVGEAGCVLVRPDHHVAWRVEGMSDNPKAELARVFACILAKSTDRQEAAP